MLEIRSPKTTRVTIEDTETGNGHGKAKFTSVEGWTDTWSQHIQRSRRPVPLYSLTWLTLPVDLDWSRSKVHNLLNWLKFYTNSEERLRYTARRAIFEGKGA
jgi:hypothetical protein